MRPNTTDTTPMDKAVTAYMMTVLGTCLLVQQQHGGLVQGADLVP